MNIHSNRFLCLIAIATVCLFAGCEPHYAKVNGHWSWVTWDEGHGTRYWEINADDDSFEVINQLYAKDKERVFIKNLEIEGANPSTFRILKGLYSTDGINVFCGNVPMTNVDVSTFSVTKAEGRIRKCKRRALVEKFGHSQFGSLPNKSYLYSQSLASDMNSDYVGPSRRSE